MNFRDPHVIRSFTGQKLLQIAMPMGGIGGGCVCLNGIGGLQDFAIRHRPATSASPDGHGANDAAFALLHVRGSSSVTKLIEGPVSPEKIYDQALQAQGYRHGGQEGLPRFENCSFDAGYPFGVVRLTDPDVPLSVTITGWSPFVPNDDVASGLPAAILEYRFENHGGEPVDFDFSYHLSHLAGESADRSGSHWPSVGSRAVPGGILFDNSLPVHDESFGSAVLRAVGWTPKIKAMWLRGAWFDSISALWREVSTGQFRENDGTQRADNPNSRSGGSILGSAVLAPHEAVTFPVVIAWHFPNSNLVAGRAKAPEATQAECAADCDCGELICADSVTAHKRDDPAWRPFYAGVWRDARAVASAVAEKYETLRSRTMAFSGALISSTLPSDVIDAVSSNLAILKSPTLLRQENGHVWAWEGCFPAAGCCHGSCTHVWNYAQAMPHLFPSLERTLREQEYERSMDNLGHVNFRSALPDGAAPHDYHAAADGQLGGIVKLYREWQICGDQAWLERLYPLAKQSLDYCIALWDPDRRGGLFEPHHNTYDIEFWGPDGMCGSMYVAALSGMAAMAAALGHSGEAAEYGELAITGAWFMEENLFNGEYYQQSVMWEGLRNRSFADSIAPGSGPDSEMTELLRRDGPKYQYGSGCLSDGVIGAWLASVSGVQTPLNHDQIRSSLQSIFQYNFKPDLFDHACLQRPGYALGHECGLLLCTWPRGGKPTLPFVYSDEVWTGIEYQVASHLISEGFVSEGLKIVNGTRSRYDGHVRNPFNEYECGSYYARAMASYALLAALSGFRYSAVSKTVWLAPKIDIDPFQVFFSTASGHGTIMLSGKSLNITVIEGELVLKQVFVDHAGETCALAVDIVARPDAPAQIELPVKQ